MFFPTLKKAALADSRHNLDNIKNIIAFSSGRDKVGKTIITVNVAVMLAQAGLKVGVLDAEIERSDGYPRHRTAEILGIENRYISNSQDSFQPADNFGVKLVTLGSLIDLDPLAECCDEWCARRIIEALEKVQWGDLDYLILNLPPCLADIRGTLAQTLSLSGVVMVATDEQEAHADIYRTVKMFEELEVPILGLIENKCNLVSADLSQRKYKLQTDTQPSQKRVPFLGYVPLDPIVDQYSDRGLPVAIAEPSSIFTSALNAIVWAITSRISLSV